MYLCRIKNPEQLKSLSPGEFGKLLGVDRIPEAKCLRAKVKQITNQGKAVCWNKDLVAYWAPKEENEFYYIDGHIQVYYGHKAKLGKKHVSRQKLCLPGMQEFWVNNKEGMPYFYVTGNVNEKLQFAIVNAIIPKLISDIPSKYSDEELEADKEIPRFTLVFDREAYSPIMFKQLWDDYRISVLTYKKNVNDLWDNDDFKSHKIIIEGVETQMLLAEKSVAVNGVELREVRKKNADGSQTTIVTTNKKLTIEEVAIHMFARWSQENFFRYMRQDYDFDRMAQYAVEQIDGDFYVVNPEYNKIEYKLKKVREKINRRLAKLYKLEHENLNKNLDECGKNNTRQVIIEKELEELKEQEKLFLDKRKELSYKIKVKDMPEENRYNKLHLESKHVQNIIKMICYRAETSFANLLSPYYAKSINEKRMLAKSIIKSNINLKPDYNENTLTIELFSLSTPRENKVVENICEILNKQNSIYPNTKLKLIYKMAT
jgi:Skp family chaperone for outer membrane proteins